MSAFLMKACMVTSVINKPGCALGLVHNSIGAGSRQSCRRTLIVADAYLGARIPKQSQAIDCQEIRSSTGAIGARGQMGEATAWRNQRPGDATRDGPLRGHRHPRTPSL